MPLRLASRETATRTREPTALEAGTRLDRSQQLHRLRLERLPLDCHRERDDGVDVRGAVGPPTRQPRRERFATAAWTWPFSSGGRIVERFRAREWAPALRAAAVPLRRIYDCRHTVASWAIAGGVSLFHLSKIIGTSTAMISDVHGHLLPDSEDYLRGLLDAFDDVRGVNADSVEL